MNLDKLFEMQKVLRDRIDYNEPDRFNKLVIALLVELGECANEWRGFKFWSKDQEPKIIKRIECNKCAGTGLGKSLILKNCPNCNGSGLDKINPLLEEYVDGLHFVLEIGIEKGWEIHRWIIFEIDTIENHFIYITREITNIFGMDKSDNSIHHYRNLFQLYLGLGEALGFTQEQIIQAYMDKNAINHQRQESGY